MNISMIFKILFLWITMAFYGISFGESLKLTHQLNINTEVKDLKSQLSQHIKNDFLKNIKESFKKSSPFNKLIKPKNVKSISYLLASDKGYGRSSFGHAYLRIGLKDQLSQDDITLEFVADVEERNLSYFKAMGAGENYGIRVVKSNYKKIKRTHIMQEDRDLTSYVLDLTREQIVKMVNRINGILLSGANKKYSFFTSNCADIVTDILNSGLDRPISGIKSVIPNQIPSILQNLKIIKDQVNDDGKTKLRVSKVNELFPEFLEKSNLLEEKNLKDLLSSASLTDRTRAYYRILLIRENQNLIDSLKITSLVTSMLVFESPAVKSHLIELFSTRKSKVQEFSKIRFRFASRKKVRIKRTRFITKGSKVYIEVVTEQSSERKYSFKLNNLKYKDGKITNKSGQVISYKFNKHLYKDEFYHPSTLIMTSIVKEKGINYLTSLLLTEKDSFRTKTISEYDEEDEIAYRNGDFPNVGMGMCYAHSELSKKLKSNAIYLPNESPLSTDEAIKLVEGVYQDNIVVIPGYKNTNEFTASLPVDRLGNVMMARQMEAYSGYKRFKAYFGEINVNAKSIYNLENLLNTGVAPIIIFKVRGNIGHSVLVTKVTEEEDYFVFNIIDPNMTYQKGVYKLDKKTSKLDTVFYGKVDARLPSFSIERELEVSNLLMMNNVKDLAIRSAEKLGNYILAPSDFYK